MAKVPKVLGEAAPKFLGTAFYTNGTGGSVERAIYKFPKREACLMATLGTCLQLFPLDARTA